MAEEIIFDSLYPGTGAAGHPRSGFFEQWFTCNKFPEKWCLDRLEDYLKDVPTPDYSDPIVERLVELTEINIEQVTRILNIMILGDKEGWRIYSWNKSTKKILKKAIQSNDDVKKMAEKMIDYLERRGYTDLGELLD
jgi:hypothetical protein